MVQGEQSSREEKEIVPYNSRMACSQIITFNPVVKENSACRRNYYKFLEEIVRFGGWDKKKYVCAQLSFYNKILVENTGEGSNGSDWKDMKYFIPFDLLAILGYCKTWIQSAKMVRVRLYMSNLLKYSIDEQRYLRTVLELPFRNQNFYLLKSDPVMCKYKHYVDTVIANIGFIRKKPYRILVTATMSAGKSTFINALTGKEICNVRNTACTGRIHTIIAKPYEDGYIGMLDHEYCMDAVDDKLKDESRWNGLNKVTVSSYFHGILEGRRIVLYDTPGVNYSQNHVHTFITQQMISAKEYDQLVYLIDAAQMGTVDNNVHLEYVRNNAVGKRIIFVLNKIDVVNNNDDNLFLMIKHCKQELKEAGFPNSVLCPVSSKAACLAKKSENEKLSKIEERELKFLMEFFMELNLSDYYESVYQYARVMDSKESWKQLCKYCGIKYIEQMIDIFSIRLNHLL